MLFTVLAIFWLKFSDSPAKTFRTKRP